MRSLPSCRRPWRVGLLCCMHCLLHGRCEEAFKGLASCCSMNPRCGFMDSFSEKPLLFCYGFQFLAWSRPAIVLSLSGTVETCSSCQFSILPRISVCPFASKAHPVGGSITVFHKEYLCVTCCTVCVMRGKITSSSSWCIHPFSLCLLAHLRFWV